MQLWKMTQPADIRRVAGAGAPGSGENARRGRGVWRGGLPPAALASAQSRPRPFRCGAVTRRRTPRRAEGEPAGRAALPAREQQARSGGGRAERLPDPRRSHQALAPSRPPGEPRASPTGLPPPARAAAGLLKPLQLPLSN